MSVRIKPFLGGRIKGNGKGGGSDVPTSQLIDEDWIQLASKTFAANTWGSESSQSQIYYDFIQNEMLPAFENGFDCTCFLYGQTGSGQC